MGQAESTGAPVDHLNLLDNASAGNVSTYQSTLRMQGAFLSFFAALKLNEKSERTWILVKFQLN
ncbi:hypothetical protein ASE46_10725 [Bacillus sp. Root239]|nr:hypothetical protein ASE46_10725 [Bacillus sp. Root239]